MNLQPYENISVTLFTLFCAVIIVYYLRIKHKERMEMIKIRQLNTEDGPDGNKHSVLSKAILALSLAAGLVTGLFLSSCFPGLPSLILYFISILFFCGIGLLIYYLIVNRAG
jgi:hypothetical protein